MRRMNPTLAVPDNLATPRAKCWPTYCEDETGRRETGQDQGFGGAIVKLAAEDRLPAAYATLAFVSAGALVSYGENPTEEYRQAAGYVDRILKGEKPADLPVQAPTKIELVVNAKSAKVIGLTVPATMLARADNVIE